MAVFHGSAGFIVLTKEDNPGTGAIALFNFTRWTVNISSDNIFVATFTNSQEALWKDSVRGFGQWSATFEGFMDDSTGPAMTQTDTVEHILKNDYDAVFRDAANGCFRGQCTIDSLDFENDAQDVAKYTCNVTGKGKLEYTQPAGVGASPPAACNP